jgi:hypothetical protein
MFSSTDVYDTGQAFGDSNLVVGVVTPTGQGCIDLHSTRGECSSAELDNIGQASGLAPYQTPAHDGPTAPQGAGVQAPGYHVHNV